MCTGSWRNPKLKTRVNSRGLFQSGFLVSRDPSVHNYVASFLSERAFASSSGGSVTDRLFPIFEYQPIQFPDAGEFSP